MNRPTAVALLLTAMALPAVAQHGGGHGGGGGHAGFSHAAPAFRSGSGVARSAPSSYAQHYGGARPAMPPNSAMALRRGVPVHYGAQPLNYGARGNGAAQGERRSPYRSPYRNPGRGGIVYEYPYLPYYGYPYGLGYYGDYGLDGDDGYYDNSGDAAAAAPYYGPDQYNGFDPQAGGQTQSWPPDQGAPPDPAMAQLEPGDPYRPYYGVPHPVSPATIQPVVTLVFKDHRPNEQIRNYLINGDTLTVWDQRPHEISLDQLDIAATEKLNHDGGVDLFLPGAPR
jgi:hypothetical protein